MKMKYCPFCGVAWHGDAVSFCYECGKSLAQAEKSAPRSERQEKDKLQILCSDKDPTNPNEKYDDDIKLDDREQMEQRSEKINREKSIPRSEDYMDKIIVETGYIMIRGTYYFKRIFSDGCAELVRYDHNAERWVILCFTNISE